MVMLYVNQIGMARYGSLTLEASDVQKWACLAGETVIWLVIINDKCL